MRVIEIITNADCLLETVIEVDGKICASVSRKTGWILNDNKVTFPDPAKAISLESEILIDSIISSCRRRFRLMPGCEDGIRGGIRLTGLLKESSDPTFLALTNIESAFRLSFDGSIDFEIELTDHGKG